MTIIPSSTSTITAASKPQHPLKEQRRQLQGIQSQIAHIDRIKLQLEQLLPSQDGKRTRRLSSSSEASSWSVASTSSKDSIASDIRGRELLVPIAGVAFAPATISQAFQDGMEEESQSIFIKSYSENDGKAGLEKLISLEEAKRGQYKKVTIAQAMAHLEEQKQALENSISSLRDELVSTARATLVEQLGEQPTLSALNNDPNDDQVTPVNEQGQALNEEGLPFVDLMEPIHESQESTPVPALVPLEREPMTREERQRWMDSILSQLEKEEGENGVGRNLILQQPKPFQTPAQRPSVHRRMSSADRPAPPKSVLKQTGPLPPPLPKFGSAGIRRGFLNLNPSSPAAEQSSDPVEAIDFGKLDQERSNSSMGYAMSSASNSLDERMSRSMELPNQKGSEKRRKKTVRIQSPEGIREAEKWTSSTKQKNIPRIEDEDVREEAKSILELLGLDVIKDHPQAAGLYEALKDSEKMSQLAKKAEAARIAALEKENAATPKKPAVSQTVLERSSTASTSTRPTSKVDGAFKRGFLNTPTKVPNGPSVSQGMSALDRATQSDKDLEKEREEKGLKPAVPHARPSKAFAEKIEAKRRGEAQAVSPNDKVEEEMPAARMSKVRFNNVDDGELSVKVGRTAATFPLSTASREAEEADMKEDDNESVESFELHISEEELDEDTVEALGYFSDEEYDPDIGLNPDEIMHSIPHFSADSSEITNEELRREYERMKMTLGSQHTRTNRNMNKEQEDGDNFGEGQDLGLVENGMEDTTKISRYKQDRVKRALSGQNAVSNELGRGLESAHNIGPMMLIPSVANVRFPVNGQTQIEGQELRLDGSSDQEDDDLEEIMRLRLQQRDEVAAFGTEKKQSGNFNAPPQVLATKQADLDEEKESAPPVAKKPSLFKSRMSQK